MKKGALILFLACVLEVAVCGWNTQVRKKMTWAKAREYCREKYTDLSTNSSLQEDEDLVSAQGLDEHYWVGLYKDKMDTWRWSGGEEAVGINFLENVHKNGNKQCGVRYKFGWQRKHCSNGFYFYCFHLNLDLVKENKTWEGAMEHCRLQHIDLVSLTYVSLLNHTLNISETAQTDHVWTGLRYLADTWLWLNGNIAGNHTWSQGEPPQCPTEGHSCGALSLQSQRVESWDCADKLNFVCSAKT